MDQCEKYENDEDETNLMIYGAVHGLHYVQVGCVLRCGSRGLRSFASSKTRPLSNFDKKIINQNMTKFCTLEAIRIA